jgi:hypothetical protein
MLSNGFHWPPMILGRYLHHLGSELHAGDIVLLTNYILVNMLRIIKFPGVDGCCCDCQQTSCIWSLFGTTIVDCVQATVSSTASVDGGVINKKCRFASDQMCTRGQLGYLGKGC